MGGSRRTTEYENTAEWRRTCRVIGDEDIVHGIRSENGSANHRPSIDGKE